MDVPAAEKMGQHTYNALIGAWLQNFAANMKQIREGRSLTDLPPGEKKPLICVGGGPSIKKYRMISKLKKWPHAIFCCDKMLRDCVHSGVYPNLVATVDGSPVVAKFYKDDAVRKAAKSKKIDAAFALTVHPRTVKTWKGEIYWFTALFDDLAKMNRDQQLRSPSFILHTLSKGKPLISAVGNVGSFLWNLAADLKYSPIILIGYDFSEQVNDKANAIWFPYYVRMFLKQGLNERDAQDKTALLHQVEYNKDFGQHYLVNPFWKSYGKQLMAHLVTSKIHTINATQNGSLTTEAVNKFSQEAVGEPCPTFEAHSLDYVLKKYG